MIVTLLSHIGFVMRNEYLNLRSKLQTIVGVFKRSVFEVGNQCVHLWLLETLAWRPFLKYHMSTMAAINLGSLIPLLQISIVSSRNFYMASAIDYKSIIESQVMLIY